MCAELTERHGSNPMDVWREHQANRVERDMIREEETVDADEEAARWKFYYRDPGCALHLTPSSPANHCSSGLAAFV